MSGVAIITFTIAQEDKNSILSIDSVLKGNTQYGPLFDIFNKNDELIDVCIGKLSEKYNDQIEILKQNEKHIHQKPLISKVFMIFELTGIIIALAGILEFTFLSH